MQLILISIFLLSIVIYNCNCTKDYIDNYSNKYSIKIELNEKGDKRNLVPKLYLEEEINAKKIPQIKHNSAALIGCRLKQIEMSIKLPACGRVLFNTTICSGYCQSQEMFVGYKNQKSTSVSSCKISNWSHVSIETKCNSSFKTFKVKAATECECLTSPI